MALRCDRVWRDARLATLASSAHGLGEIEDGLVACSHGRIVYAGAAAEAPAFAAAEETRCEGRWITPGLVDCHTHLVFAGDRSAEFERRAAGETYADIARAGGGILSTVAATSAASEEALTRAALTRLDALLAEGATTVEVKSGYGLTAEAELASLRVIAALAKRREARIVPTLLALHALPPEWAGRREAYVAMVCEDLIPAAARAGLAQAVDAFCETIAFSPAEVRRALEAAKGAGLAVKLHAEQLTNQGGAALAAGLGALSADHLEYLDDEGVAAMAGAGTVAVLLPGAFYFTRESKLPPVAQLRGQKVPMALATDCNPGTSPLTSLLMTMNLAATLFRLTVAECLAGVTREGARALGLASETGTLEAGKACDLAIWEIESPAELVWRMGLNPLWRRVWRGL